MNKTYEIDPKAAQNFLAWTADEYESGVIARSKYHFEK